jgi:methylmalonyl-CoA/ethylmalonyl-CoA epimerase
MKFHHMGLAVPSIKDTADLYSQAGYRSSDMIYDANQHVNICWIFKEGMPLIELIESDGPDSPVNKILRGGGSVAISFMLRSGRHGRSNQGIA